MDQLTFIGFDTETTGKYPLETEVCEIGAIKYRDGKIVDEFQTLIKPKRAIPDEVIKIHGITNEMVVNSPTMAEVIPKFHEFIKGGYLIAHHAPFDLGFLCPEFEQAGLSLPELPVICSSRLARVVITDSPNHKLQTLIPHLGLHQGSAHRAGDDATACLELALACFKRGNLNNLDEVLKTQGGALYWKDYSIEDLKFKSKSMALLIEAIRQRMRVRLVYKGGSKRERVIEPIGLVRNPDGDFFVAYDDGPVAKRFYIEKVEEITKN